MAAPLPAIDAKAVVSFLGIRQKDLPYEGKAYSDHVWRASPLKGHGHGDAFHLLSSLTGVASLDDCVRHASVKKIGQTRPHSTHGTEPGFAGRATEGCSTYKGGAQELILAPASVHEYPPCFEKALDTTDLSFWMYTTIPNDKSNLEEESYSDADSEELERRAANENVPEKAATCDHEQVDEHTKREEFRARVKESLSFVRMRMEMLQDLSLGEASKEESAGGGDTSFMSSTSVLLKHARKQAGILHTEEQAVRLQDLYQWFLNIGKILGDDALGASSKSFSLHDQLDRLRSLNVVKDLYERSQEPKPAPSPSPFELLRRVEHDVRDRLANLYQGKNYILSHQADIWANRELGSSAGGNKEEMLHATMERLQKMESAYEMLGTTILESLKEVERMEDEFHVLQSELVTKGCPLLTISHKKRSKRSSQKGNKKGTASESDSMNTSSRSESSSAESSARPPNVQPEGISRGKEASTVPDQSLKSKGSNALAADEKSIEAGGKAESKGPPKKKKGSAQKTEKKKAAKQKGKDDVARPSPLASAEASTPAQASSHSASSPVLEATTVNGSTKEERCKSSTPSIGPDNINAKEEREKSASPGIGIGPDNSNAKEERGKSGSPGIGLDNSSASRGGVVLDAPASRDIPVQEGAKPQSSDPKGQVGDERPGSAELPRSSKVADDLPEAQNRPILPKPSLGAQDGRDVVPSDSASLKSLSKPKRKSRRLSSEVSKDESVQTDDVAILSLEDCDVESLRQREYQAADVKDFLENMKKMRKQLQFWRTKNWAEKHTGQGKMMPPPVYNQFIKVDASPDMGMVCYYNPRTGVNVMRNLSDLDTSMQQSIMNLVTGPGL